MKKELLFDAIGEIRDDILDHYHQMDVRLAHKHAHKKRTLRVFAIAACLAILIGACVPLGMLIAHLGKQPPGVVPGIEPTTQTTDDVTPGTDPGTSTTDDVTPGTDPGASTTDDVTPGTDPGTSTTDDPIADPPEPPAEITVNNIAELEQMRAMLASEDEQALNEYLSAFSGGYWSKQDLTEFLNLVDSTPYAEILQGEIIWLNYSRGTDQAGVPYETLNVSIEAEDGTWVRYRYILSVEDATEHLEMLTQQVGNENLLTSILDTADGRLALHTETRKPHPSGTGDLVTWWGELDSTVVEIAYYVDDQSTVNTQSIISRTEVFTGIIQSLPPIVPPSPPEPLYAWENTQFGAFLEQPEFHAYLTYDTPSPQLDQFVKNIEVNSENYMDASVPAIRTVTVEGVEYTLNYYYSTTQDLVLQATHYYRGQTEDGRTVEARFDQETDACIMFWLEGGFLDASIYQGGIHDVKTAYLSSLVSDFDAYYDTAYLLTYQGKTWDGCCRSIESDHFACDSSDAVYYVYNSETHMIEGFMLAYTGALRQLVYDPAELTQFIKNTIDSFTPTPNHISYSVMGFVITTDGRLARRVSIEVMNDLPGYNYSVHDKVELLVYVTEPINEG